MNISSTTSKIKVLVMTISLFCFSLTANSFSPLDPFLWPDPNFKPKLDLVKFKHFKKPKGAMPSDEQLYKSISVNSSPAKRKFKIISDTLEMNKRFKVLNQFPDFTLDLIIRDSKALPINQSVLSSNNIYWDVQFGQGESWLDDFGNTRSSLPFALVQKNQNCVHNGVMVFDFDYEGQVSNILYQIASETCPYFKFDAIGILKPDRTSNLEMDESLYKRLSNNSSIIIKSINKLDEKKNFGSPKEVKPEHLSVYGFFDGQDHNRSLCKTRSGNYPYCSEMLLPSFSLSKSLVASLSLALLEREFPDVKNANIQDYVPACKQKKWNEVKFVHALNMATGQYFNKKWYSEDWYLSDKGFSLNFRHKDRIKFACSIFSKKSPPGMKLSYHSSDTYILGVALNNFYKTKKGDASDIYRDLILPFWKELELSQATYEIRRSIDNIRQPYMEYGMFLKSDDVVKLGAFLLSEVELTQTGILADALQANSKRRGLVAIDNILYYNNGFWAKKFKGSNLGCTKDVWIPFMSGFGGITVALMPNKTLYYYFSDDQDFAWDRAVIASNKISPFCPSS